MVKILEIKYKINSLLVIVFIAIILFLIMRYIFIILTPIVFNNKLFVLIEDYLTLF